MGLGGTERLRVVEEGNINEYEVAERRGQVGSVV